MSEALSADLSPQRRSQLALGGGVDGVGGVARRHNAGSQNAGASFQHALNYFLNPPRRARSPQRSQAELLTVNPHLNLRLVTALHPGASVVSENGQARLEIPLPQLDQPGLQAHSEAIRQATGLDRLQKQQDPNPTQGVQAEEGLEVAFGKVVVSSGLAASLMGQGIRHSASVQSSSLAYLLQDRVPAKPADPSPSSSKANLHFTNLDI